jgi:DNA-binding CsgD family transcriptional regulator
MGEAMAKMDTRTGHMGPHEPILIAAENQATGQTLSDLEAQVLLLVAAGKQNAEVAVALGTGQAAVKQHIKSIFQKAIASDSRPRRNDLRPSELACERVSPFTA